jgi:hypothetical protein
MTEHLPITRHLELSKDKMNEFSELDQDFFKEMVDCFRYIDGTHHPDGSVGIIKITPKQLSDMFAYIAEMFEKLTG